MKRIRIAQSDGLDWKKELRKYVTVNISINHATTGKSPTELVELHTDQEVCDHDTEQKAKTNVYAGVYRETQQSGIAELRT